MKEQKTFCGPAIWGGIECTINRIGDEYKDQLKYSGHYDRAGDIEAIAALGIQKIRYPILWEKHLPVKDISIDWRWTDRQLDLIRASGMKPIAGLLHHGSGPSFTNLLDPAFPYLLASFAYEVASRYPWIDEYTPVNEPLTTARFSGLYGLWFPHHSSEFSFYSMLLNQLKATVLCMQAIRSVNPSARLIQTEDLGKTYSTSLLAYQANFENERRLLTFDILSGRLKPGHPQYTYILNCGIKEEDVSFFQLLRTEPDVLGLNFYVTSERWLDERLERYPPETHGGNRTHHYADTEAVRAEVDYDGGFKKLATEIWERYHKPLAVTEVHLHCTREEQLRWFKEILDDSVVLTNQGIDIQGVTAWALLGSFDWDSLLTKTGTQYESGVFDIKTFPGVLKPTALTTLLKSLSGNKNIFHPVLDASGWWHMHQKNENSDSRPLVILEGADPKFMKGSNASEIIHSLATACTQRRIAYRILRYVDENELGKINPWAIVNTGFRGFDMKSLKLKNSFQYISFDSDETDPTFLRIIADKMPLSVHQINKVLDLVIDGDTGCWIFNSDEIIFKTEEVFHVHVLSDFKL